MPSRSIERLATAGALLAAGLALTACQAPLHWTAAQSSLRIAPDYSVAVREDAAAQISNPDAHYKGVPDPASDGMRTADAEKRYRNGTVKQPPLTVTQQSVQQSASGGAEGGTPGTGGGGPP